MRRNLGVIRNCKFAPLTQQMSPWRSRNAANDNGRAFDKQVIVDAALRHFGDYGLSAAQSAQMKALDAQMKGDRQNYLWWLEVCRILDRRMAERLEHPHSPQNRDHLHKIHQIQPNIRRIISPCNSR